MNKKPHIAAPPTPATDEFYQEAAAAGFTRDQVLFLEGYFQKDRDMPGVEEMELEHIDRCDYVRACKEAGQESEPWTSSTDPWNDQQVPGLFEEIWTGKQWTKGERFICIKPRGKSHGRLGTIAATPQSGRGFVSIRFDGNKCTERIYVGWLEPYGPLEPGSDAAQLENLIEEKFSAAGKPVPFLEEAQS